MSVKEYKKPKEKIKCSCGGTYIFSRYCGAYVCQKCGNHKGLARCFCGWNLSAGEKLDDDVGNAVFDGKTWEVDY